jgi:hypothetical protein
VAALTQRIRLGTSVIDALYHSPVVLGRRLATLDRGRHLTGTAGISGSLGEHAELQAKVLLEM